MINWSLTKISTQVSHKRLLDWSLTKISTQVSHKRLLDWSLTYRHPGLSQHCLTNHTNGSTPCHLLQHCNAAQTCHSQSTAAAAGTTSLASSTPEAPSGWQVAWPPTLDFLCELHLIFHSLRHLGPVNVAIEPHANADAMNTSGVVLIITT